MTISASARAFSHKTPISVTVPISTTVLREIAIATMGISILEATAVMSVQPCAAHVHQEAPFHVTISEFGSTLSSSVASWSSPAESFSLSLEWRRSRSRIRCTLKKRPKCRSLLYRKKRTSRKMDPRISSKYDGYGNIRLWLWYKHINMISKSWSVSGN